MGASTGRGFGGVAVALARMAVHADEWTRATGYRASGAPRTIGPQILLLGVLAVVLTGFAIAAIAAVGGVAGGVLSGVSGGLALAIACTCISRARERDRGQHWQQHGQRRG